MSKNFSSPYAKPMQQYPSQSEDYISLEIGGPGKCSTPARSQYQNKNRGNEASNFYQNRGRGNQHNRMSGGWNNNRKNFGNYAEYGQRQQRQSYGKNEASRSTPNHRQNNKQSNHKNDISTYFHPSMLEDPWKELMERRDAIRRSEISIQTPANPIQENDVIRDSATGAPESEESGSDMDDAT